MRAFLRRLRARIKYRHFERDLAQEIEQHRAMAEAELTAAGESAREARWKAARQLGNTTLAREDSRAAWIPRVMQQVAQDVRYAIRGLRREWGFTLAAVTILALGLGLTIGGFTFINGLLFRAWPVPDNRDVFRVVPVLRQSIGMIDDGLSYGAYQHIVANARTADYVAMGYVFARIGTTSEDRGPRRTPVGLFVSDNFFHALHIPIERGTAPITAIPGSAPTVVISHQAWQTTFGGDPAILGRTLWLDGQPATVAGVTAAAFTGLDRSTAVYAPLPLAAQMGARGTVRDAVSNARTCCVNVVGRARPGASPSSIRSELETLTEQYRSSEGQTTLRLSLTDTTNGSAILRRGGVVAPLLLLTVGVLFLVALICANVGNLYLARSLRRQHEITTRLALGASRSRLVRQLLTEGLVLSSIAGVLAFLAATSVPTLMTLSGTEFSAATFAADWRVGVATALSVVAVCLLISLAPALRSTQVLWRGGTPMTTMRTGGLHGTLLAFQIAIATVLILSATLIARGIQFGVSAPSDFALETTTVASLTWPTDAAEERARASSFRADLAAAIRQSSVPIGLATQAPATHNAGIATLVRQPEADVNFQVRLFPMTASAADVLRLRLTAGRWASDDTTALEAVVNETLATRVWGQQPAIGRTLRLDFGRKTYTVVGVSADAQLLSPGRVEPIIHIPPISGTPVLLTAKTREAEAAVRALIASVEPTLAVTFTPLTESIKGTVDDAASGAAIAGGLGLVALLLAMIGVYGVFSYLVEDRRREIGIRLALGAERTHICATVFRATRSAVLGGLAAGLALSIIAGAVLRRFLFGMSPADPVSYLAVAIVLAASALIATFIPLRRALRMAPAVTLRAE